MIKFSSTDRVHTTGRLMHKFIAYANNFIKKMIQRRDAKGTKMTHNITKRHSQRILISPILYLILKFKKPLESEKTLESALKKKLKLNTKYHRFLFY